LIHRKLTLDHEQQRRHDRVMTSLTVASSLRPAVRPLDAPVAGSVPVSRRRLAWLALGTFALGTESLVIGGVLPKIATDLDSSLSTAGLLVTVFAITYAISAPIMGTLLSRFAPKSVLTVAMWLFVAMNLAASVAPTMGWLMIARVGTAVVASMYTPNASAMAGSLSAPHERGRALALVYVGLSLATVFGVPLGTLIAGIGSWRTTFVFVALIGVVAAVGVGRFLPEAPRRAPVSFVQWKRVFADRAVLSVLSVTTIFFTAQFAAFTYIAKTITEIAGHPSVTIPIGLLLFGAAGFAGNALAGRLTDTWGALRTIRLATLLMAAGLAALTPLMLRDFGGVGTAIGVVALLVWGVGGWALNPAQQMRLLAAAPEGGPTVLAANSSALYLGTALGGLLGSTLLRTVGMSWIGTVAAALALTVFGVLRSTDH
jgi:MFS transporter, DHA1 family, inner membrane transport protein